MKKSRQYILSWTEEGKHYELALPTLAIAKNIGNVLMVVDEIDRFNKTITAMKIQRK